MKLQINIMMLNGTLFIFLSFSSFSRFVLFFIINPLIHNIILQHKMEIQIKTISLYPVAKLFAKVRYAKISDKKMIIVIPKNSYQYFSTCLFIKRFSKNICMITSIIYVKKIRNNNSLYNIHL